MPGVSSAKLKLWALLACVLGVQVHSQGIDIPDIPQDTLLEVITSNVPEGVDVDIIATLVKDYASESVRDELTSIFSGTMFVPSDNALRKALRFQSLSDLPTAFVDHLLKDHLLPNGGSPIQGSGGTKTYVTWGGNNVNVTFGDDGSVVEVEPAELFPSRNSTVLGSFSSSLLGLSLIYLDDVVVTPPVFTEWVGSGAKHLTQAVWEVNAQNDGMLAALMAVGSASPRVVEFFSRVGLKGTFFAPRNEAFTKLLQAAGLQVDSLTPVHGLPMFSLGAALGIFGEAAGAAGLPNVTNGLRELVDAIIFYHFVPAGANQTQPYGMVSANLHEWNGTEFNTLLGQQLGGSLPLKFMDDDMWKIQYGLGNQFTTNVTAGFADAKITTTNGFDWMAPVNNGSHDAHLHVINDVLLPIPNFRMNLTDLTDIREIPLGQTYNVTANALRSLRDSPLPGVSELIQTLLDTSMLRGAIFLPSDEAIESLLGGLGLSLTDWATLLMDYQDIAQDIIKGHIIFDTKLEGTGTYPTLLDGYYVNVTIDPTTGMPAMFERATGSIQGLPDVSRVKGSFGPTLVGQAANLFGGTGNGFVYYVDEVIVPGPVADRVNSILGAPAAGPSPPPELKADIAVQLVKYNTSQSFQTTLMDPNLSGTVFLPIDAAFQRSLQTSNIGLDDIVPAFVEQLLLDHVAVNTSADGSLGRNTFITLAGNSLEVMVDRAGNISYVKPVEDNPLQRTASILGVFNASSFLPSENLTAYFIDNTLVTRDVYDTWLGGAAGAKNLVQAVQAVHVQQGGLRTLLALLNLKPKALEVLSTVGLKGTLFAPRDEAFATLLSALGLPSDFLDPSSRSSMFSLSSLVELFSKASGSDGSPVAEALIKGIRRLVDAILFYHFIPAGTEQPQPYGMVSANLHEWNGTEFNTLLGQELGEHLPLRFVDDDMWKIQYGLDNQYTTNVTAGFADAKITTTNGFNWMAPVNNGSHDAHLHVINDVLLPFPELRMNLTDLAATDISDMSLGQVFNMTANALKAYQDSPLPGLYELINGSSLLDNADLHGAIFLPSDEAIQGLLNGLGFSPLLLLSQLGSGIGSQTGLGLGSWTTVLTEYPSMPLDILKGHMVLGHRIEGTGSYPTLLDGYEITVHVNSTTGMPTMFERPSGSIPGLPDVSRVQGSLGLSTFGQLSSVLGGSGNGLVHTVDEVVVPGPVLARVNSIFSDPSSGSPSSNDTSSPPPPPSEGGGQPSEICQSQNASTSVRIAFDLEFDSVDRDQFEQNLEEDLKSNLLQRFPDAFSFNSADECPNFVSVAELQQGSIIALVDIELGSQKSPEDAQEFQSQLTSLSADEARDLFNDEELRNALVESGFVNEDQDPIEVAADGGMRSLRFSVVSVILPAVLLLTIMILG